MGKLRTWLIHRLGGYTWREVSEAVRNGAARGAEHPARHNLHPVQTTAAYAFYVEPDTPEILRSQAQIARTELAKKIALEMMDQGRICYSMGIDSVQDRVPIKRYRMRATVWTLDATQMPVYGGGAP